MSRLIIKLTILALIVLGAGLFLPAGSKVYADPSTCTPANEIARGSNSNFANPPTTPQMAQNQDNFGVNPTYGQGHGGNMAGMIVQAVDGQTNAPVDAYYHLHSGVSYTDPDNTQISGQTVDLNKRIFNAIGGSNDNAADFYGRVKDQLSQTGGALFDPDTSGGVIQCPGWDAFGPDDNLAGSDVVGNGDVLDCEVFINGKTIQTHFWLSNISNPTNDGASDASGNWEVVVEGTSIDINNFTNADMSFNNHSFVVANGSNTFVKLIWWPSPPQHTNPNPPTAACTTIKVTDDGGYDVPNGNSNPRPTQTQVIVHGTAAEEGGAPSSGYGTNPGIDTPSNQNPIGDGQSRTWSNLTPISSIIYVQTIRQYKSTNGVWNNILNEDTTQAIPCYSASCSVSVDSEVPGDPNGVIAGETFTVHATIYGDGPNADGTPNPGDPSPSDLASNIEGDQLSFNNGDINGNNSYWGFSQPFSDISSGGSQTQTFTLTAPDDTNQHVLEAHPAYSNLFSFDLPAQCGAVINVYKHFTLQPTASSQLSPSNEDPTSVNYPIGVIQEPDQYTSGVPASLSGTLYDPAGQPIASANYSGTYVTTAYNNPPPSGPISGTLQAGQQYCAESTVNPGTGYIGPSGVFDPQPVSSGMSCDHVANEPYFKVYGSGVNADLNSVAKQVSGTYVCTPKNGSGLLAGWNDNQDLGSDRGAGSQLSALALIGITGFASAQTNINRAAADLTFANSGISQSGISVPVTSGTDSPELGGYAGAAPNCVTPPGPAQGTTPTPLRSPVFNFSAGRANTSNSYTGNLTINGGTVNNNTYLSVVGNVYISDNGTPGITYNSAGWSYNPANGTSTIPSFVLSATGNIYISPNVTKLDGTYVSGGTIYTCGNSNFTECQGDLYDIAGNNKQLLVTGSFVANQIKMLRTFGSLRDETPTLGTKQGPNTNTSVEFSRFVCASPSTPFPGIHFYQAQSTPPLPSSAPSGCTQEANNAGYVLPTNSNNSVPLYYITPKNKGLGSAKNADNMYTADLPTAISACKSQGWQITVNGSGQYINCPLIVGYVQTAPGPGLEPLYGVYGGNSKTHFYTKCGPPPNQDPSCGGTDEYDNVVNAPGQNDQGLGIIAYVYSSAGLGGTPGPPIPIGISPPSPLKCSNYDGNLADWPDQNTCAAEVFQFSPEIFLSNPNTGNKNNGAAASITSLPPVL